MKSRALPISRVVHLVTVQEWGSLRIPQDTLVFAGEPVLLWSEKGNGLGAISWYSDLPLDCTLCDESVAKAVRNSVVVATVADTLGCHVETDTMHILILPDIILYVPTAFTPNGDGVNDLYRVFGKAIEEVEWMQIFNRWGEVVFETRDLNEGWDGRYSLIDPRDADSQTKIGILLPVK